VLEFSFLCFLTFKRQREFYIDMIKYYAEVQKIWRMYLDVTYVGSGIEQKTRCDSLVSIVSEVAESFVNIKFRKRIVQILLLWLQSTAWFQQHWREFPRLILPRLKNLNCEAVESFDKIKFRKGIKPMAPWDSLIQSFFKLPLGGGSSLHIQILNSAYCTFLLNQYWVKTFCQAWLEAYHGVQHGGGFIKPGPLGEAKLQSEDIFTTFFTFFHSAVG